MFTGETANHRRYSQVASARLMGEYFASCLGGSGKRGGNGNRVYVLSSVAQTRLLDSHVLFFSRLPEVITLQYNQSA